MSATLPFINDWEKLHLEWQYIEQTIIRTKSISANGQLQVPIEGYIFGYPEIILLHITVVFDDPSCGIRIEGAPEFDSEQYFTVTNLTNLGLTRPDNLIYVVIPPTNPAGRYTVRVCGPWIFKDWMRLYMFNSDTSAHNCLYHSYDLAVLKDKRPKESILPLETMNKIQLAYDMLPDKREELRSKFASRIEELIEEIEIRKM